MSHRTVLTEHFYENTTAFITGTIHNENKVGIPAAQLTTLKLWVYDKRSKAIINSLEDIDILNANNVTLDVDGVDGNLELELTPDDMPMVNENRRVEAHIAQFKWTYASGTKAGAHEVEFNVYNLKEFG